MNNYLMTGLASVVLLASYVQSHACTDFRLTAKDNTVLVTRTLEFALDLDSHFRSSPRERAFITKMQDDRPAISWMAKYGYVYLNALGQDLTSDGMNEMGLSFEYLYLPGETQYQTVAAGKEDQALPYIYFGDWVLSQFASIEEVKAALKNITVFEYTHPALANRIFPMHASIFEKSGKGIVIEFVEGKINVYDHMGVMTNSPQYPWQTTNLRNYVTLNPYTQDAAVINGVSYAATGQGQGMLGLPGDVSPPSRFVKMAVMGAAVTQPENEMQALNTAIHMVNNVDIPLGYVRTKVNGQDQLELTQWTVFKNLTNGVIYYKTYEDQTIRSISLKLIDFSPGAAELDLPLSQTQMIVDMNSEFVGKR